MSLVLFAAVCTEARSISNPSFRLVVTEGSVVSAVRLLVMQVSISCTVMVVWYRAVPFRMLAIFWAH